MAELEEEKQKAPAGNSLFAIAVFSFVMVSLMIALYAYLGETAPIVTGEVVNTQVTTIHRETPNYNGAPGDTTPFDEQVIVSEIKIHNTGKDPLFIRDFWETVKLDATTDYRSTGATKSDIARAYLAYPTIPKSAIPPLERDTTIAPGTTADGIMVFNYPITKEAWDKRVSLDIGVGFIHQNPLTIHVPK